MEAQKPVTLLLVRHGQAQSNVSRILTSYPEAQPMPLSPRGRKEIQKTAEALVGTPIAAIFASPLTRTQESAAIISKYFGLPVITEHRLRETDFGKYNNGPSAKFFLRYPHPSLRDASNELMELEGLDSVRKRLKEFLRELVLFYSGKTVVLVTHSDIIHELLGILNGTGRYMGRIETGSAKEALLRPDRTLD